MERSIERSARSGARELRSFFSSVGKSVGSTPSWVFYSLGGLTLIGGSVALVMMSKTVSKFMQPLLEPVGELFGLSEDDGIDTSKTTHNRSYSSKAESV